MKTYWEKIAERLQRQLNQKNEEIKYLNFVLEKTASKLMRCRLTKKYIERENK